MSIEPWIQIITIGINLGLVFYTWITMRRSRRQLQRVAERVFDEWRLAKGIEMALDHGCEIDIMTGQPV